MQSTILVLPLAWFWVRMPSKLEQIGLAHSRGRGALRRGTAKNFATCCHRDLLSLAAPRSAEHGCSYALAAGRAAVGFRFASRSSLCVDSF
jgi:hypothetical protein